MTSCRVAVLSVHTSPLELPGSGDAGGMNVYIREVAAEMARRGVQSDIFTRRTDPDEPERARLGRVLHRPSSLPGEIEARPQRVPLVVVPRQRIDRRAEPGNLFAHERVLARRGVVGEVAGTPRVTGIWAVPAHEMIYASAAGNHEVVGIDEQTLKITVDTNAKTATVN